MQALQALRDGAIVNDSFMIWPCHVDSPWYMLCTNRDRPGNPALDVFSKAFDGVLPLSTEPPGPPLHGPGDQLGILQSIDIALLHANTNEEWADADEDLQIVVDTVCNHRTCPVDPPRRGRHPGSPSRLPRGIRGPTSRWAYSRSGGCAAQWSASCMGVACP